MTKAENGPCTIISRTKVLKISPDTDRAGNTVSVAHLNFPGASIVALGENHDIKPGQEVDLIQTIYNLDGRRTTSSRIRKVVSPPTPKRVKTPR